MAKIFITEIDTVNNVAFTDSGNIFEIETYVDENDDPCLHENATHAYVRTGSTTFIRVSMRVDDDEWDDYDEDE